MDYKNRQLLIKKLLYQSCNRGCKETDLIIGKFAESQLAKMSDQEMKIFAHILKLPDADIYDWYTAKKPVPDKYQSPMLSKLLNFVPIK